LIKEFKMLKLFSFKMFAVLLVVILGVAAIGNAASLTVTEENQTVVQGTSNVFTAHDADVTYDIDEGNELVKVTVGLTETFDLVSFSYDQGTSYVECTAQDGTPPDDAWVCSIPFADAAGSGQLEFIAVSDDTTETP
jgi:hypothetical protein